MGIWSDTKSLVSSLGNAVSDGVAYLDNEVQKLEMKSHQLLLESKIDILEKERATLRDSWFATENKKKRQELHELYEKRIALYPYENPKQWESQFSKFTSEDKENEIKFKIEEIASSKRSLEKTNYPLAINAIAARKIQISRLKSLQDLLDNEQKSALKKRANDYIGELKLEISELETKRATKASQHYSSGAVKSVISKYDGKKNGLSSYRYENGNLKWSIPFVHGDAYGTVKCFRSDGSKLMEMDIQKKMRIFRLFTDKNDCLVTGSLQNNEATFRMIFSNTRSITIKHKKNDNLGFTVVKAFMKNLWTLWHCWRARKPGPERARILDLNIIMHDFDRTMSDLEPIIRQS